MALSTGDDATTEVLEDRQEATVVWLHEPVAADRALTGAKAANLAIALQAGLPVYDGFALTTLGTSELDDLEALRTGDPAGRLHTAWARLTGDGQVPLAVRSSSVVEDSTTSSMAGRFVSVLHVSGWDEFVTAVFEVVASAATTEIADAPIAVLVQPMAEARCGGVLFGLDPLTGDRSHYRVSVTEGLPDQIVSGAVTGTQIVLGKWGAIRSVSGPVPAVLGARHRAQLAALARKTGKLFGSPQDVEWLIDPGGTLRLLQSRPITASALPVDNSHPLGPGPVAETFPNPLRRLERDLWEPPLERGIREALRISGAVSKRALEGRFVIDVGGRVAVDLEALGVVKPKRSFWRVLDPRPSARHLRAAWRIGRLRTALPAIVHDLVGEVDADLAAVPEPRQLGDLQLLTVLDNSQQTLAALHAYEVLSGFFLEQRLAVTTGASVALSTLARARADGFDDTETVGRHPVVLALVPPEVGGLRALPPTRIPPPAPRGDGDEPTAVAREALRLRVRWVQELSAVVAEELGRRLAVRSQLHRAIDVTAMGLDALRDVVVGLNVAVLDRQPERDVPPLPARFRLAADGSIVPDVAGGGDGPIGVSAGRAKAEVTHDRTGAAGKALVVRSLDPDLAAALADVAALVSETGSPLSHLAILAREYRVPTVVGVVDAWSALHDGDVVLVDGAAGTVEVVTEAEPLLTEDAPPEPADSRREAG